MPFPENFWHHVYPLATLRFMKDVGLRIRIDRDLREQFLKACQADDKPAAQVLREFMRAYVAERGADSAIIHGGAEEKDNGIEP